MPLEVKNVSFYYNKGLPLEQKALDGVTINIPKNSYTAVIGHTGSGKSTLMQMLNGLLKPDEGEVMLDGENIHSGKITLKNVRQRVGLVFQYPEQQLFEETVYKDVAFGPANLELNTNEIEKRVTEALKLVGIEDNHYHVSPFSLSGGEKRRVALAGVLAMQPEYLILDEPTAGLDPLGRKEIMSAIHRLHQKTGVSVVLVTHNMEEVARYAEQVYIMSKGKVLLSGTPQEVFKESDMLAKVGLKPPTAVELITKLNEKGCKLPTATTIPDAVEAISRMWGGKHAK